MQIRAISLYPVKATRGVPVGQAVVEPWGLRHDRRWAIVDLAGTRLNARRHDALLAVTATPGDDGGIVLTGAGREPLPVPAPTGGPYVPVDISRFPRAVDAGDAAARWFSSHLGADVRLIWQDDPTARTMSTEHGGSGEEVLSLADTGPLLLTSTRSLEQLNDWIGDKQMVMERFRPNVVVEGADEPFTEDDWARIRLGDVPFRFAEHCDRCMVTTIDPDSLRHGKEPIRTLAQHRKWAGKTWFGVRIIPLGGGTITLGDEVAVEA